MSQAQVVRRLGISQPEVCRLMQGRFTGFSAERLIALLTALELEARLSFNRGRPSQSPPESLW